MYFGIKLLDNENTNLSRAKTEASELERVQASLKTAKKDIETYSPIEQIAKSVVPQEKDQARTIREIVKLAEENNIAISSINFPSSNLGSKSAPGNQSTNKQQGSLTQTQKVPGINNVERLEVTVSSDSSKPARYRDFIAFLESLEQNRRTSQVSSINIQPQANGTLVTFSLVINVYIKK